ncbi:hypothetical protein P0Y35_11775 [Kiritimatiellaeota bacterium B1221]|nr:hypothetical protein [Kiritimatiellaeota bacterium B1221]
MSKFNKDIKELPANACSFSGAFSFESNGVESKTKKFKMTARSGEAIEHWFWGSVIHDMQGLRLHKNRLPIDFNHDARDLVGYCNNFDTSNNDLQVSGALTPTKKNSAEEIIELAEQGVPLEASINFAGDNLKVQLVNENEVAEVNGYTVTGPKTIIREWDLRGIAITPYGADMNTSTNFNDKNKKVKFSLIENDNKNEEQNMFKKLDKDLENETVEAEATEAKQAEVTETEVEETEVAKVEEVVETEEVKATELTQAEVTETKVEEAKEEAVEVAEVEEVETKEAEAEVINTVEAVDAKEEQVKEDVKEDVKEAVTLSLDEYRELSKKFSNDFAEKVVTDSLTFSQAKELGYEKLEEENKELKAKLAQVEQTKGAKPVTFSSEEGSKKVKLFNISK